MKTDLSTQIVDALTEMHGFHAGHRAAHAKGLCCTGTFTATPAAGKLTRAAHMQGDTVPVTVRFSNGTGSPTRADGARDGRGMATKFHLPDRETTDIVALTLPMFFVRTPEDFLEFTIARKPDPETGKPDLSKVEEFVANHPEAQQAIGYSMFSMPPASYVQCRYFAIHAFKWIDAEGGQRFVKYRWEPEAGEATITDDASRALGRNYLSGELTNRLEKAPAVFDLHIQVAEEGDDPDDPTAVWPEEREVVLVGRLELTGMVADQQSDCEALIFDPTRVIDGIECSADRILHARPGAYSVSYERRTAAR
jgi:catalase